MEGIAFLPCRGLAKMGSSGLPSRAGQAREGVPRMGEAGVGSSSLVKAVILLLRKSLSLVAQRGRRDFGGARARPVQSFKAPEIAQCLPWRDAELGADMEHLCHHKITQPD